MTQKFNPLTDTVKPISKQSFELAPDPVPEIELDTKTPAVDYREPRRFTLGDLPRYADALYPHLKRLFPHINDRMYGGWIRGCINDNSCLFICITDDTDQGAVGMAFIGRDPLNPVPFVDVLFVIGSNDVRVHIYQKIMKWGQEIGAHEVRIRELVADEVLDMIPDVKPRESLTVILDIEA